MTLQPADVPVFVLCGGLGTRLSEMTGLIPKPMVPIGERPIIWHVLRTYAHHGFRRFVLCLGYRSDVIKSYFLNYASMNSDFTVRLKSNEVTVHSVDHEQDWDVTLAYTGELSMTGSRVAQAAELYVDDAKTFAVTYGDGLTNANLRHELEFHESHGRIGTVLGANPPSRFGEFKLDGKNVERFDEKPDLADKWINGGYFFFERSFLDYLSTDPDCVLERAPLVKLADDGQLSVYKHPGFWACMDTKRDMDQLNELWASGDPPWAQFGGH